jgi:hypothetical protein
LTVSPTLISLSEFEFVKGKGRGEKGGNEGQRVKKR